MQYLESLESPLRPSLDRYWSIFVKNSDISIYRALEYEALSKIQYSGRVLDFGGGQKAHYVSALKSWIRDGIYESVNISDSMQPTYLIKPGDVLPIADRAFDMVVSVNTLEHVYDLNTVLKELVRVLTTGGHIILAVPFLFRVHGCPNDYHRPTASWWSDTLTNLGLTDLKITPLVWDALTSGLSVTEGVGPLSTLRRLLVPLYGLLYAQVRGRSADKRYPRQIGESLANLALGYVITGVKQP